MQLREEAAVRNLFGIQVYAYGLDVAIGLACAMLVLGMLFWAGRMKKGSAPLTAVLSILLGAVCSRLVFCLLNQELGFMMPLRTWVQVSGGGWSLFGMIGGALLGGWISAKLTRESSGKVLDYLCCALLPVIIAVRLGESLIEDFDISRPLQSTFLNGTFLAVGEGEPCLATYYVAAFAAAVLFFILLIREVKHREQKGHTAITFLLLFGASAIITESLRYDRFLSITFVGLQQIMAAVMLMIGVVLAAKKAGKNARGLKIAALASLPVMIGAVIAIEFALDRSTASKLLLYAGMAVIVMIPAVLGIMLLKKDKKGNQGA